MGGNRISDVGELDRLDHLCRSLTQLNLANNAVARKQLYRPTLAKRLSNLRFLDGKEVTPEERERAEMIFNSDRAPPSLSMAEQRQFATKVRKTYTEKEMRTADMLMHEKRKMCSCCGIDLCMLMVIQKMHTEKRCGKLTC